MPRIVFSFAFFRQNLPVQLVSTATKSRWKFYAQVGRRSFHTAWTHERHSTSRLPRSRRPSGWSLAHGFPSCATETTVNTTSDTTAFIRPAPLGFGLSGVRLLSVWLAGLFLRTRYSAGARAAPRNYAQWRQAD